MRNTIQKKHLDKAYDYKSFRKLVDDLLEQGKATSGNDSEMPLTEFTKLNVQRMSRIDKTLELKEELKKELQNPDEKWYWVVLAEGWCGDVSQNLPVIAKIADASGNIDLKILLRDQNLDIMDQYLTNGGRSIPKLICLDADSLSELGTWGPRPEVLQKMVMEAKEKKDPDRPRKEWVEDIHEKMHKWYADDKGETIQKEFIGLIKKWETVEAESK
jgi:hypothetical protein